MRPAGAGCCRSQGTGKQARGQLVLHYHMWLAQLAARPSSSAMQPSAPHLGLSWARSPGLVLPCIFPPAHPCEIRWFTAQPRSWRRHARARPPGTSACRPPQPPAAVRCRPAQPPATARCRPARPPATAACRRARPPATAACRRARRHRWALLQVCIAFVRQPC